MTPELWILFYTTILLTVLWIPHIIGQVMTTGILTADDYKNLREQSQFPAWVRRANRAHINLVEQYGAFAGLVVIDDPVPVPLLSGEVAGRAGDPGPGRTGARDFRRPEPGMR